MSKRVMGKASFCNIQDLKGNIQCYVARDERRRRRVQGTLKRCDIGDIVGVKRPGIHIPKTGENFYPCQQRWFCCTKSLQILPEKYPRPDQHRYPLPSALCGPDHERRCERYFCQSVPRSSLPSGNTLTGRRLYGSGDCLCWCR